MLSESSSVIAGLRQMMDVADGASEVVQQHVEASIALLVIEIAKLAEEREEWFPRGKWATIQNIQESTDRQLRTLFSTPTPKEPT